MIFKISLDSPLGLTILGRANENPPWRHGGRCNAYCQLVLILSGECVYELFGESYAAKSGDLLFTPGGSSHDGEVFYKMTTRSHCEFFFACFNCNWRIASEREAREYLTSDFRYDKSDFYLSNLSERSIFTDAHTSLDDMNFRRLVTLFTREYDLYNSSSIIDRMMIDALFTQTLLTVGKCVDVGNSESSDSVRVSSRTFERIKRYIAENYTERITPELLSSRFGVTAEHVCALFKEQSGTTLSEYVTSVKLTHGAELLLNSSMNVSQIADYLGFSSVYYFSRLFKKRYLMSPTDYVRAVCGE